MVRTSPFSALPRVWDERRRAVNSNYDRIARGAATAAGRKAVLTTRVDTGEARSNWIATKRSPTTAVIPPYSPGRKRGITEKANANRAIAQHKGVISTWEPHRGSVLFIANNVPHIGFLNFGSETTSADNMLRRAKLAWADFLLLPKTRRQIFRLLTGRSLPRG